MKHFLVAASAVLLTPLPTAAEVVIHIGGKSLLGDELLYATDTISSEQLSDTTSFDLGQTLTNTSGIEVTSSGGIGQNASIFFRGTDSNHNLVLLNGVAINDAITGQAPLHFLNPGMITQVDVIKGPNSTLWGNSAIGGVINIDTAQISAKDLAGTASLTLGSHDTQRASISKAVAWEDKQFKVALSKTDSDGIQPKASSADTGNFDNTSISLSYVHNAPNHKVFANVLSSEGNAGYDNYGTMADHDYSTQVASVSFNDITHSLGKLNITFALANIDTEENNGAGDYAKTDRRTLTLENQMPLGHFSELTLGTSATDEKVKFQGWQTYQDDYTTYEAYANYTYKGSSDQYLAGIRYTEDEYYGGNTVWNLGYGVALNSKTRIKSTLSTAYKTPNADERFGVIGNAALKPERSKGYEIGVEYQATSQQKWQASLFNTDINDYIVYATGSYYNAGKANIQGLDLSWNLDAGPWKHTANLLWQDPQNESTGTRLLKRAKAKANISSRYTDGDKTWIIDVRHSGDRTDAVTDDGYMSAYTLVNTEMQWQLDQQAKVSFKIENLTNTDYEITDGYETNGRSFYVGLSYTGF